MIDRDPHIPLLSLLFGYGPALILFLLAVGAWLLPSAWATHALYAAWLWGAVILLFLAGVARGLSFATDGGPQLQQVARSIGLFLLALAALLSSLRLGFPLLAVGYLIVGVADPREAQAGRAPAHFARLRPTQMGIAAVALIALAAYVWTLP
jgi:hypothetical protein